MKRHMVTTAIVSAILGAGLMLLATGGRPSAGIEGWTPLNEEIAFALEQGALENSGRLDAEAQGRSQEEADTGSSGSSAGHGSIASGGSSASNGSSIVGNDNMNMSSYTEQEAGGSSEELAEYNKDASITDIGSEPEQTVGETDHHAGQADAGQTDDGSGLISINQAELAQLQQIPGIGEKKAQAIINYRNENGPFNALHELKNVKGIGDKLFQKMKPYIRL